MMTDQKNAGHVVYLDALRIFAVFAMMMLHVAGSQWANVPVSSFSWQVFNFYDSLVRFCVPVFIMISGALFLDNARPLPWKKLFGKNLFRIVSAYLFWSACYALTVQALSYASTGVVSIAALCKDFVFGRYHLWFLFVIAGLYLITPFLRKITADKLLTEYFLLLFFVFSLLVNFLKLIPFLAYSVTAIMDKLGLNFVLGYSGYYIVGYYLHHYEISKLHRKGIYVLGLASLIVTILFSSLVSEKIGTATSAFYADLLPTTFFVAISIFCFFKYNFPKISWSEKALDRLFSLAKLSFCMYLIHDFINILFAQIGFTTLSYCAILSVPLNALLVFFASLLLSLLLCKIPVLNRYVM